MDCSCSLLLPSVFSNMAFRAPLCNLVSVQSRSTHKRAHLSVLQRCKAEVGGDRALAVGNTGLSTCARLMQWAYHRLRRLDTYQSSFYCDHVFASIHTSCPRPEYLYVNFCLMKNDLKCDNCHAQVPPSTKSCMSVHLTILAFTDSDWSRNSASRSCSTIVRNLSCTQRPYSSHVLTR